MRSWQRACLAAVVLAAVATDLDAQQCPANDSRDAREVVEMFLAHPQFEADRVAVGIAGTADPVIRLLTDASDAAACAEIRSRATAQQYYAAPWATSFYRVGDFYYVVARRTPVEETRIRIENGMLRGRMYRAPFMVLNADFEPVFNDVF